MSNLIEKAKLNVDALIREACDRAVKAGLFPEGAELRGTVEIPKDTANGDYTTSKFNVLYGAGFRYYISHTTGGPSCKIAGNYVRQLRIMVTGTQMAHAANTYAKYFDSQSVLNSTRGNVPQ